MNDLEKVNAEATDHNRQQALRILVLTQGLPEEVAVKMKQVTKVNVMGEEIALPNGSFTLCQLVRALEKKNCFWHAFNACCSSRGQWFWHEEWIDESGRKNTRLHLLSKDVNAPTPYDLTGAADAYIAYLELQKQMEDKR